MLTENDVIINVVAYLKKNEYDIIDTCKTTEKGIDIIAIKDETKLYIEAKGETSSRTGEDGKKKSNRAGNPFNTDQIKKHIAVAVLYALEKINEDDKIVFALAFPENHKDRVSRIFPSLHKLGIKVFFVSENGTVRIVI